MYMYRVWLRMCTGESPSCARVALALGATVAVACGHHRFSRRCGDGRGRARCRRSRRGAQEVTASSNETLPHRSITHRCGQNAPEDQGGQRGEGCQRQIQREGGQIDSQAIRAESRDGDAGIFAQHDESQKHLVGPISNLTLDNFPHGATGVRAQVMRLWGGFAMAYSKLLNQGKLNGCLHKTIVSDMILNLALFSDANKSELKTMLHFLLIPNAQSRCYNLLSIKLFVKWNLSMLGLVGLFQGSFNLGIMRRTKMTQKKSN